MPHEAVEFLTAIWNGPKMPPGLYAQIWAKGPRDSRSNYLEHWMGVEGIVNTHVRADVYVGCAAVAKKLSAKVRGKAKDAAAIPGFWLDIDIGPGNAASVEDALAAARALVEPSLTVRSGGGVHAWYLFDEPWRFADDGEREDAALLCAGWVEAHREVVPFKLDSVGELARVLRLPGTGNHKTDPPTPVSIIDQAGGRFPRDALADHARGRVRGRQRSLLDSPAADGDTERLPDETDYPRQRIRAMRENDEMFRRMWERLKKASTSDWSDSQFDQSIIRRLRMADFTFAEAVASCTVSRLEYGDPAKVAKVERLDYWQMTWSSAGQSTPEEEAATSKAEEAKLVSELKVLREDAPTLAPPEANRRRWDKLNDLIGGGQLGRPKVIEWNQYGSDPDTAKHEWVLSDGIVVPLGTSRRVLEQGSVRAALMTVSDLLPRQWKASTWDLAIHAVMPLRQQNQAPEEERDVRALEWVSQVVGERTLESSADHLNEAIQMRRPFLRDGRVWITQGYLGQQLRLQKIAPDVRDADLAPWLKNAGFERSAVHFNKEDGSRGSRSYWSVEAELIP